MPMDTYAVIGALVRAEIARTHTVQPTGPRSAERTGRRLAPACATTAPVTARWRSACSLAAVFLRIRSRSALTRALHLARASE